MISELLKPHEAAISLTLSCRIHSVILTPVIISAHRERLGDNPVRGCRNKDRPIARTFAAQSNISALRSFPLRALGKLSVERPAVYTTTEAIRAFQLFANRD